MREPGLRWAREYAQGDAGARLVGSAGIKRNPQGDNLFMLRGRAGSLVKLISHMWIGSPMNPSLVINSPQKWERQGSG